MLASVTWYLMLPPPADGIPNRRLTFEPLSQWLMLDHFDSQRSCEAIRTKLIEQMPGSAIDTSRCVPSNAPELNRPKLQPGVG